MKTLYAVWYLSQWSRLVAFSLPAAAVLSDAVNRGGRCRVDVDFGRTTVGPLVDPTFAGEVVVAVQSHRRLLFSIVGATVDASAYLYLIRLTVRHQDRVGAHAAEHGVVAGGFGD